MCKSDETFLTIRMQHWPQRLFLSSHWLVNIVMICAIKKTQLVGIQERCNTKLSHRALRVCRSDYVYHCIFYGVTWNGCALCRSMPLVTSFSVASGISIKWRNCFFFPKFVCPQFSMEFFQVTKHWNLNKVFIYLENLSALIWWPRWIDSWFKCSQSACAHFLFIDQWKHLYIFKSGSEIKPDILKASQTSGPWVVLY